ncbi:MAG: hypothetical protein F6K65_31725, partial [Moorea sp. SIO3C2]|nr:hypothetical protein [Moorena sp. SIO3C2]
YRVSIEEFRRIVLRLSNQMFVRHWLNWGATGIEETNTMAIAWKQQGGCWENGQLMQELEAKGFRRHETGSDHWMMLIEKADAA